jgi:hypothetical protein
LIRQQSTLAQPASASSSTSAVISSTLGTGDAALVAAALKISNVCFLIPLTEPFAEDTYVEYNNVYMYS